MSYSIHRQPKYLIVAYRESGTAMCMGCVMEEYPSDFETHTLDDLEQVIEIVAKLQAVPRDRQEPEWEIQIFSDETALPDDFDRRVEEATRRKTAEHEKASREAEKKERAEAAERQRQRDMKNLQRLRAKYEEAS